MHAFYESLIYGVLTKCDQHISDMTAVTVLKLLCAPPPPPPSADVKTSWKPIDPSGICRSPRTLRCLRSRSIPGVRLDPSGTYSEMRTITAG